MHPFFIFNLEIHFYQPNRPAMKPLIFIPFYLLCLSLAGQSASHDSLIQATVEKYRAHQSLSYTIDYTMKFFDSDEPIHLQSEVFLIRSANDTIFKGSFLYGRQDSVNHYYKYYHPESLYIIDVKHQKITSYDASLQQTSPIHGNIDGNVLRVNFFEPERLLKKLQNTDNTWSATDSAHFLNIHIRYPDDEDFHGKEEHIYIDKNTLTIPIITYQAKYEDQIQQNRWHLKDMTFDRIGEADLAAKVAPYMSTLPVEKYQPRTEADLKLMENGTPAPPLTGHWYPDYTQSAEAPWEKITILDFWYTSCMPCIKTIPHLNRLQEKYSDHLQIIGVNPIEKKEKDSERIARFLQRTPMDYPILFPDEIPAVYNIKAYPTLYILDAQGIVRFSKIGHSEDTFEELDKVISELIQSR
jgi:thiol-disulfide isomerase/thioredoxin